ncbi:carbohydrate ABC transporter permease [Lacrimispora defluvii]|uniref:Sugar ABC transporter permease n=1 Tax=Lacrimispora defluvii TaxID=2719233 RepID=A0ABX1VKB0_9FIRM|nr:sugar ABC transporter permease [Lacrimispora defluvii]NNJ28344.1 sugar ABC transporter permease [Lacrimispora defluvii]
MKKKQSGLLEEAKKSVLLMPSVLLLLVFFVAPILLTVYYSFTNLALSGENARQLKFIGLSNYFTMFKDRTVRISIGNTLVFLLGSLIGQQVLGFIIALNMRNKNRVFRGIAGPIFLAGWIMPEVVVALCCSTFFGDSGTLNQIFSFFHLPQVEFLFAVPMLTVILANIWHGTAFSMMNFQSALDGVPADIEEAARVDGAGPFQTMIRIVLPCIKNTIATNTMLNTLSTLGVFGLIYMMTGGGPGTKTLTLPIFMYRQAFISQQLGYGTAISMILLVIGIVLSVFYTRIMRND